MQLPPAVEEIVEVVAAMGGVEAVALGGSRATGEADAGSDWDLGVYYRDRLDTTPLAAYGQVHPPGAWGRIMCGGAWLRHRGVRIDVVLRDLAVVEHWTARAERGTSRSTGCPATWPASPPTRWPRWRRRTLSSAPAASGSSTRRA